VLLRAGAKHGEYGRVLARLRHQGIRSQFRIGVVMDLERVAHISGIQQLIGFAMLEVFHRHDDTAVVAEVEQVGPFQNLKMVIKS